MDRISRIQNPKALHVVQLIIIIIKQIYWKGEKKIKELVGCFDMDASPEFCLLPSIDARAVFFSFVGLGFVTPISPFMCDRMDLVFLCLYCYYLHALFLFSPPSLSLHDACVISFFLSNTHKHIQLSFIKFFLPVSSLSISITRSNHSYLIHSVPLPTILSNFHIHSPIPTSSLFLLSKKNQTHEPCIHPISTAWQHHSFYSYYSYSSIPSSQQQAVLPSTTPTTRMKHYSTSSL